MEKESEEQKIQNIMLKIAKAKAEDLFKEMLELAVGNAKDCKFVPKQGEFILYLISIKFTQISKNLR